jgi:hypothetical protein
MISLPIPETGNYKAANIRYSDLRSPIPEFAHLGEIVAQLTAKPDLTNSRVHLDPHLDGTLLALSGEWRALFGQDRAAQGHLRKQGVTNGDLFLFYGLYRRVKVDCGQIKFRSDSTAKHVIFGWMRIGEIVSIGDRKSTESWSHRNPWGQYHAHLHGEEVTNNTLYVAADKSFDVLPGAGVFSHYSRERCLTAAGESCSVWLLPEWLDRDRGDNRLSYNNDRTRWNRTSEGLLLRTKSPGQEYVLDAERYPEARGWAREMISNSI